MAVVEALRSRVGCRSAVLGAAEGGCGEGRVGVVGRRRPARPGWGTGVGRRAAARATVGGVAARRRWGA